MKEEILKEFDNITIDGEIHQNFLGKDVRDIFERCIDKAISQTREETIRECKNEDFSDGYHTFKELYEFRKVFNACLFNEWHKQGKYEIHKSKKHFDGEECFGGGWFIVVAVLPTGQISNHYELKDWDLFKCEEVDKAKYEFDGHTPQNVLERLKYLIN
jgi:hypothetical protein